MIENNYKYKKPNERRYLKGLIEYLKLEKENEIVNILNGSRCLIKTSSTFSRRRWNAHSATIIFQVPINNLKKVSRKLKEKLMIYCDKIMPDELGYDVINIDFLPLIDTASRSVFEDLEDIVSTLPLEIIDQVLPDDIRQKGKEMGKVYLILYYIENFLRLFIENTAKSKLGTDYFDKLDLNRDIRDKLIIRKENESKNRWLGERGDSALYYLDFEDLSAIIRNNWSLFGGYFPNQNWITTKIKEMADCRNLVAHNSFIEEHGRNVIKTNYVSILRQLNSTLGDIN